MIDELKNRIVQATTSLFSHGPRALAHTLDHQGDPGLLGPDSVSWRVIGDAAAFVGGIRALLVQTAHPEVVAGVEQHSAYRTDPLGRLTRTSLYVTETTFGAMAEVEAAVATVQRAHRPVHGTSERGRPYRASRPDLAAWVHNVLTDSFLAAHQAFGPRPLSAAEADRFVEEQSRIGALLHADPLPTTAAELRSWIVDHPDTEPSQAQHDAIEFLGDPPLSIPVKVGYRMLHAGAVATIPAPLAATLALSAPRFGRQRCAATIKGLRWALGSSPSWKLALVRADAPDPPGVVFRQSIDLDAHRSPA